MLNTQEVYKFSLYQAERKFLRIKVSLSAQYKSKACAVVNVSSSGAGLIFVETLVIGKSVEIEVQTNSRPIILRGEIIWLKHEGDGICPAGMKFYEVLPLDTFLDLTKDQSDLERR